MTRQALEIYEKKFLPLYNSKKFEEAEEIARKNNLGTMLNDKQFAKMFLVGGKKSNNSATNFMDCIVSENVDGALKSFHDNENINNYWINAMEIRLK